MKCTAVVILAVLAPWAFLPAQQRMVGIAFNGSLYSVNPTLGTGTSFGSTGLTGHGALARIDDVLLTHDNTGRLHRIDPWTGGVTAGPMTSPALNAIRAMAVSRYGKLFVIQNGGGPIGTTTPDLLYTVDPRTGAATLIGSTSSFAGLQAMAFDGQDQLFGWDTNVGLVTMSPSTASTVDVNPGVGATVDIQSMAFAANGVLYGARHSLFAIDRAVGTTTVVGSGGFSDLRGLECVHGPCIHDNGGLVTHPGIAFGGADASMVQTTLGLQSLGSHADVGQSRHVVDDFQTNGPWLVDCIETYVFYGFPGSGSQPSIDDVRLAIYDGEPGAGGQLVPGSPDMSQNLRQTVGHLIANSNTDAYRVGAANPLQADWRIQRVRVYFGTPLALNSATLPSGRYWLRMSFDAPGYGINVPLVSTLGLVRTGNGIKYDAASGFTPMTDGTPPVGQAYPFRIYGTSIMPPAIVSNLGGSCGPAPGMLDIRGATVAGGTVVHELIGTGGFPGVMIGFGDPAAPMPGCGCILHTTGDFFAFGTPRYDLVAPAGVGTGFEYRVQGVQIDFGGASGLPCDLGLGFDYRLTDGFRVRFW